MAVVDPDHHTAKREPLQHLADHNAEDGVTSVVEPTVARPVLLRHLSNPLQVLVDRIDDLGILIEDVGDCLVLGEVVVGELEI